MVNTMMENENVRFANISIPFLRSYDIRKEIKLLFFQIVFSFSIIIFNMMKLLVILFIMKWIAQINIFRKLICMEDFCVTY